jgi:hypothetical protein
MPMKSSARIRSHFGDVVVNDRIRPRLLLRDYVGLCLLSREGNSIAITTKKGDTTRQGIHFVHSRADVCFRSVTLVRESYFYQQD